MSNPHGAAAMPPSRKQSRAGRAARRRQAASPGRTGRAAAQTAPQFPPPTGSPARPVTSRVQAMDTPQRLRVITWALAGLCLLLAVVGLSAMTMRAQAMDRAEAQAIQLIRVQKVQTNLLAADAIATNGFLVGGLEPAEQRAAYDDRMTTVGELITEAATAQPADRQALAALNTAVDAYAGGIQQARANNRVGYPIGSQYLRNASTELRQDAMPIIDNLVRANQDRVQAELDRSTGWVPETVGVVSVVALALASLFLARTFHRWVNVGVAIALLLCLLATIFAVSSNSSTSQQIDEISDGPYTLVTSAAAARIEANNAKANESLTLIARGSGSAFEDQWQASAGEVESQLATIEDLDSWFDLADQWEDYAKEHEEIRDTDNDGDWDAAVELATDPDGRANRRFTEFDGALADYVFEQETGVTDGLSTPRQTAFTFGIFIALCGVGAAVASIVGVGRRLKEYR